MWKNKTEYNGAKYEAEIYNDKLYILEGFTLYEEIPENKVPKWLKKCVPGTHQDGYLYSNVYGITCHKFFKEYKDVFYYMLNKDKYYFLEKDNTELMLYHNIEGYNEGIGFRSISSISLEDVDIIIKKNEEKFKDIIYTFLKNYNIRFQGTILLNNQEVKQILNSSEPKKQRGKRIQITLNELKKLNIKEDRIMFHVYINAKINEFW